MPHAQQRHPRQRAPTIWRSLDIRFLRYARKRTDRHADRNTLQPYRGRSDYRQQASAERQCEPVCQLPAPPRSLHISRTRLPEKHATAREIIHHIHVTFFSRPKCSFSSLRNRNHNKILIPKTSDLNNRHFLIRVLYKPCY